MKKKFESFEKLALGAVLSKNEQKNVFGGDYGGGGGGGGGGYNGTYQLFCWVNNNSVGPHSGTGCPSFYTGRTMCKSMYGSAADISNIYCQ